MFPNILIAGTQKGGTTTLFETLVHHPDVQGARAADTLELIKEPHFFDGNWERGMAWYSGLYDDRGQGIDATPNYLSHEQAHARMAEVVGDARIVISLRDPVSRAYSQYNHYKQDRPRSSSWDWLLSEGTFAENVGAELALDELMEPRYRGFVARGFYMDQIESLLRFYPRERIHVMVMERWAKDPEPALDALLDFLELERVPLPIETRHDRAYTVEPMDASTRRMLSDAFDEPNRRLFAFLLDDIPEWR